MTGGKKFNEDTPAMKRVEAILDACSGLTTDEMRALFDIVMDAAVIVVDAKGFDA